MIYIMPHIHCHLVHSILTQAEHTLYIPWCVQLLSMACVTAVDWGVNEVC